MSLAVTAGAAVVGGAGYALGSSMSGGGGGGGGGGSYNPGMTELDQKVLDILNTPLNWPKMKKVIPGEDPLQQTAYGQAEQIQATGGPYAGMREAALMRGLSGAPVTTYDPAQSQALFQTAVGGPAQRRWREDTLPQIGESLAGRSLTRGGDAERTIARGAAEFNEGLAAQEALWQRGDIADARKSGEIAAERQQGAVQPSMAETMFQPNVGLQVGALRRGIKQEKGAYKLAKALGSHPGYNPGLQLLPQAMGAQTYGLAGAGPGYSSGGGSGTNWGGALSGAASGALTGMSIAPPYGALAGGLIGGIGGLF